MKKAALLLLLALFASNALFSQPWQEFLPKDKSKDELTLFDYQEAFETYWQPFHVSNGYYKDANGNKQKALVGSNLSAGHIFGKQG